MFVASPNHNSKLPILSISYPSRFPPARPAFRPSRVRANPSPRL